LKVSVVTVFSLLSWISGKENKNVVGIRVHIYNY
jgi:hypothetical protein